MKLTINTEYLSGCSQRLSAEASQLSQAAGSLNVSFSSSLARYRTQSVPAGLKYCKVQSGSLSGVVASYRKALKVYQSELQELSSCVAGVARTMEATEARLRNTDADTTAEQNAHVYPLGPHIPNVPPAPPVHVDWDNIQTFDLGEVLDSLTGLSPEEITDWLAENVIEGNLLGAIQNQISESLVNNTSIHGEASIEGSLGPQYGFTNEYGGGQIVIGGYEGEASFDAGLFSLDENGNAYFNPALSAAVGLSVTAFQASIAQDYNLAPGVSAGFSGNVTVGELDANASANFGLFQDGQFNPSAHVSANLQATAVEASAEGHVNVAGIEGSVEAGVFIGAGAHFDAGFEDGVLTLDFGAGLGFGVNASASLDFSGLIDTAAGMTEAVGDFAEAAGDFMSDLGDAASGCLESIFGWF